MAEDTMFSEAVAAARAGEVVRARDLLARLLRADSANPDYWLWMSAVVDSERESVYCLRSVVKMRPNHPLARLGLGVMGQISLGRDHEGPIKQHRSSPMPHQSAGRINSLGDWWKVHRNRENAAIAFLGFFAVVVVLAIVVLQVRASALQIPMFGGAQTVAAALPTETTAVPTELPTFRPIPTLKNTVNPSNLIPFATFVGVELTPTSIYGITPMPISGALDYALTAYREGRYEDAINYLDQVLFVEKKSAQAWYLKGEVYRLQWKMKDSLAAYEEAIKIDPNYAPAYFGRAMWSKQNNPDNDYDKDLDRALDRDAQFIDAYIERAYFNGRRGNWEKARDDLIRANQIAPDNAFVLIRLGRAQIHTGQADLALDHVVRAQIIDPTILEGYLALGEAYDALQLYVQAVYPLKTYTTYDPEEILGWLRLGEAYTGTTQYPEAIDACAHAVEINVNSVQARLCRGRVYRLVGEYKKAVDDLKIASDRAPNVYSTQFAYGCSLLENDKPGLAIEILNHALELAVTVEEKADVMGWLALAFEKYQNPFKAQKIWEDLMAMEDVPEYWRIEAYKHLFGLTNPTPGTIPTITPAATSTSKP
jgi:tetratricopeptide (TPR) repeat protein